MRSLLFFLSLSLFLTSCSKNNALFSIVDPKRSQITFNNTIIENDSLSILDNEFFYNGAGVALGDLNNDGLLDVFFAGNQVDNQLYINKGNLRFSNESSTSGVLKTNPLIWTSGVNLVDVNQDGLLDIYLCNTLRTEEKLRANLLYINQGIDSNGIPRFEEQAVAYGLADTSYSSHAQFFDFDKDGDLDVFIGVNQIENIDPNVFQNLQSKTAILSVDKLYENKGIGPDGTPLFEDISKSANISLHGFSHSTLVYDINQDGWLDLYVSNDYLSNDIAYLNQGDKTFKNEARAMFKHFSLSSMGSDLGDVNNDGKLDLFISEMQPYYNKRKKLFQKGTSYTKEILTRRYDYEYQYPRNVLQLNQGTNPNTNLPLFSEIGMNAGIAETDWSWASLFADFDNDGKSDLFIANGFPKDVIDKDFGDFRVTANRLVSREQLLAAIPQIKVSNFIFKNKGSLEFEDRSESWGINFPSFTNGAVYGDLDNDGDLDLLLNNINDTATLLENTLSNESGMHNFVRFELKGSDTKPAVFGSELRLFSNGEIQTQIIESGRGYLSQPEQTLHFGLGAREKVDSIVVRWYDGNIQKWNAIQANTTHELVYDPEKQREFIPKLHTPFFKQGNKEIGLTHKDEDDDFIDFNLQITLPYKFSQSGPSLAVGDMNNDGLEDVIVGGSRGKKETIFYQNSEGTFSHKTLSFKSKPRDIEEDTGIALFDVENDGDLDIYFAHGSGQFSPESDAYDDALWINQGNGSFKQADVLLPNRGENSSCVKAGDFDNDGDMDLFVGNRVVPGQYPVASRSYLLENKSDGSEIRFVDASDKLSTGEIPLGLINDALWTDFNNDGWQDLIVIGEWMSILFFENHQGFLRKLDETGVNWAKGWWKSLASSDLDNDGDLDYIIGNFGENTFFKASAEMPMRIIAKDFDKNGSVDPFISFYVRDSLGIKRNYPYHPWEDVIKQFRALRKEFNSYGDYGSATMDQIFVNQDLTASLMKSVNWMKTSWVENLGEGKFKLHSLPLQAQWAPVYGINAFDVNQDGYDDLLMVGNDYGIEVNQGRMDALQGLVLINDQSKNFIAQTIEQTNFVVPRDGKSIAQIKVGSTPYFLATQNNDSLKAFKPIFKETPLMVSWSAEETSCLIYYNSETTHRKFKGNFSFQSQGTPTFWIPKKAKRVEFFNAKGQKLRTEILNE